MTRKITRRLTAKNIGGQKVIDRNIEGASAPWFALLAKPPSVQKSLAIASQRCAAIRTTALVCVHVLGAATYA